MAARVIQSWLLAAMVLTGCAASPPQPESMRDPTVDFAAYRTFGWSPGPRVDGADQPLMLLDRNLRAAIAEEMRRKGYVEAAGTPDLRMAYETTSEQKVEGQPVRVGVGMGSWGGNFGGTISVGSPSVRTYRDGTLVVHAVDNARNAEVWQGRISTRVTKGSLEPAAVTGAVRAAMSDFPARQ